MLCTCFQLYSSILEKFCIYCYDYEDDEKIKLLKTGREMCFWVWVVFSSSFFRKKGLKVTLCI